MAGTFDFSSTRARIKLARILELVATEPLTNVSIAARLHTTSNNVNVYLRKLREDRQIFIADYDMDTFRPTAMWLKGDAEDKPAPPPKTKAQIWLEIKADPKRLARVHADQERLRIKKRGRVHTLRKIRVYDPPLPVQVQQFVDAWPGSTATYIADKLDASMLMVQRTLKQLKQDGVVCSRKKSRAGLHWELTSRKPVTHAPLVTKRQGLFAALGV